MNRTRFSGAHILNLCLIVLAAGVAITARSWPLKTALFPLVISITVLITAVAELLMSLFLKETAAVKGPQKDFKFAEDIDPEVAQRRTLLAFAWIIGFFLLILLLGFPLAVALFTLFFVRFQGHEKWGISLFVAFLCWFFFWSLFVWILNTPPITGWIFIWLKMIGIGL